MAELPRRRDEYFCAPARRGGSRCACGVMHHSHELSGMPGAAQVDSLLAAAAPVAEASSTSIFVAAIVPNGWTLNLLDAWARTRLARARVSFLR